jgi:hypothetical protein
MVLSVFIALFDRFLSVFTNSDRTCPSRKNSDFLSKIREENRRNSDFSRVNFLPSSAATALYILINKGQQQINRTLLVNLVNFRLESEKFRSVLQAENTEAPATRRPPAGSVKGARSRTGNLSTLYSSAALRQGARLRERSHPLALALTLLSAPPLSVFTGGLTQ